MKYMKGSNSTQRADVFGKIKDDFSSFRDKEVDDYSVTSSCN